MRGVGGGRWRVLLITAAASLVTAAATLLPAAPASADTTLTLDPGYAGSMVSGRALPVRVAISADRLLKGDLEVAAGKASALPVVMPVEVPGGSQKQFDVVVPTAVGDTGDVTARLRQGDRVLASAAATARIVSDDELVGLLPGALAGRGLPGPAPLAVDVGTARFVAVSAADLDQAPGSLDPLSTIGAGPDELSRLAPGARRGLLQWVEGGGRLLVDAEPGHAVAGLPDAWQPGTADRAPAGSGEVRLTSGAMAAGRWPGLVEPTARSGSAGTAGTAQTSVAGALAEDAGLRVPELGWLVAFLVAYVVLVGPVLFLILRRRRRAELAWVAVPLVAVLFAAGSYVGGRGLRHTTSLVAASVVRSGASGPSTTTYVGAFSPAGETARVDFPQGWSAVAPPTFGGVRALALSSITLNAAGARGRVPLDPGQFAVVAGSGPAATPGGLDVTAATEDGGRVGGRVRNTTHVTLDDVAVFLTGTATKVGSLGPGEERAWTLAPLNTAAEGGRPQLPVWPDLFRSGSAVRSALWQSAQVPGGPAYGSPGTAVAAGWTIGLPPEVRVDGRQPKAGSPTLVIATAPVAAGDAGGELAVRRDIVRGNGGGLGRLAAASGATVVRFVVPAAERGPLVLHSALGPAEVWADGGWTQIGTGVATGTRGGVIGGAPATLCPSNVPCPPATALTVPIKGAPVVGPDLPLPAGAVAGGVVFVRLAAGAPIDRGGLLTLGRAA